MELSALGLTLRVAIVATAINIPVALIFSWLIVKRNIPGRFALEVLISLPLAVPPVAIGFFLLAVAGRSGPLGALVYGLFGIDIVFTWIAAVLASAIVSFPLVARTIMVAIEGVDPKLEASARSLGAKPLRVLCTITIPLAYRGILAGMLLGFVRALSEFGATIVVAGNIPGYTQTLSLGIYSSVQLGNDGIALRLMGISIALAVITIMAHNWLLSRSKARHIQQ